MSEEEMSLLVSSLTLTTAVAGKVVDAQLRLQTWEAILFIFLMGHYRAKADPIGDLRRDRDLLTKMWREPDGNEAQAQDIEKVFGVIEQQLQYELLRAAEATDSQKIH